MKASAFSLCLLPLLSLCSALCAAPLRVDFNTDVNRGDVKTAEWENLRIPAQNSAQFAFGSITLQIDLKDDTSSKLESTWWKRGYDTGATLSSDGITPKNPDAVIRLQLRGLTPGTHSITTFHNVLQGDAAPLQVQLAGLPECAALVTPSVRITDDLELAFAHINFKVTASGEIAVLISKQDKNTLGAPVLNGFVLDGPDPRLIARRPKPFNGDEHAPEETLLSWDKAANADLQAFYLGDSEEAVASATPQSPEFKGYLSVSQYQTEGLSSAHNSYWRVDQIDKKRTVSKGEVWSFRPRRLAFPEAEGYGRFAIGGRGGRTIEVTTLDDSGPGSLREAIDAEGPRTVVFRVGGAIQLKSKLIIKNPYITIAGQTAPGDGIAVYNYTFGAYGTHDVIIRYMRIRIGDASGATLDGSGLGGCDHAIMDHCSIAWSIDEGFSSRGAKNITLQRSLITEPLNLSVHSHYVGTGKGHAYAGSVSGDIASLHHNLLVHCAGRNWSLAGGLTGGGSFAGRLDIRNNVVYNWSHRTNDGGVKALNLVGNFYIPGPSSKVFHLLMPDLGSKSDPQTYYVAGNSMEGHPEYDKDNWSKGGVKLQEKEMQKTGMNLTDVVNLVYLKQPFCEPYVNTQSPRLAYASVMADVGANKPHSDSIDQRALHDVAKRSYTFKGSKGKLKGIIDSQKDVGGYPVMKGGEAPADNDHDGMSDSWERANGLNPADPKDANSPSLQHPGFTRLEEYLNTL